MSRHPDVGMRGNVRFSDADRRVHRESEVAERAALRPFGFAVDVEVAGDESLATDVHGAELPDYLSAKGLAVAAFPGRAQFHKR